jgi:hypothetical protein
VSTADSADNLPYSLRIGSTVEISTDFTPFKGIVDEIRVWSIARTEADIQHDFERILKGDEPGLVTYLRVNETDDANLVAGWQLVDTAGNQNSTAVLNVGALGSNASAALAIQQGGGRQLITPFQVGVRQYEIAFNEPLGQTLHLPATEADQTFSSVSLGGQPVVIPLGDINGDGHDDMVISVRDLVADANGLRNFIRIAFGTGSGITLDPDQSTPTLEPPITIELPAPVLAVTASNRSVISAAGDVNGAGIGDIAVSVNNSDGNRVYLTSDVLIERRYRCRCRTFRRE